MFVPRAGVGRIAAAPMLLLLTLSGCGGHEGLAPVSGTITYKGKPVTKGEVNFVPEKGELRGAHGPIDEQGRYTLGTFEPGDGAYVGTHRVSVVSIGPDKPIPAKKKGRMMEEDMQGTGEPLVPKRYLSPATSDLKAEVEAGKSNVKDFDLQD